jgi:sulfofructose kinase
MWTDTRAMRPLHYAKACRERGIATSLDGGAVRENTDELLKYIDVAVISELFCETWGLSQKTRWKS